MIEKIEKAYNNGMITERELLDSKIKELTKESDKLKKKHKFGNWDNWRRFMSIDLKINNLKMRKLELDNQLINESLESFKDC